jgi:hypothetical protein
MARDQRKLLWSLPSTVRAFAGGRFPRLNRRIDERLAREADEIVAAELAAMRSEAQADDPKASAA